MTSNSHVLPLPVQPLDGFMHAVVQDRYGSADVLELRDVAIPELGDSDVLVKVVAAGVDRGASHFMTGKPYLMRYIGFGLRAPKSPVPGTNFAGHVEAVGRAVTTLSVGDAVYGSTRGTYAAYAKVEQHRLAPKPTELSFEEAAVLPYAGFAALQALREHGRVQAGQRVLVVGASGAVGTVAVQIAKAMGAHVTGVCSSASAQLVRELGADEVIDYESADFTADGSRYDVVIDIGGRTSVKKVRRTLVAKGRLVIVGGEGASLTGIGRQVWATFMSLFVSQRMGTFLAKENRPLLEDLNGFVASGSLRPYMLRAYPLALAADAIRTLDAPHQAGRVVITAS
jgi:NADPH:quinone reductase-like Zn-dependent oxidoreductase